MMASRCLLFAGWSQDHGLPDEQNHYTTGGKPQSATGSILVSFDISTKHEPGTCIFSQMPV